MPDEEMGCGCGCQDCECKEVNVCDTTDKVHADLRDKLMVFKDYVCTIALTPCSQLGKVMSKVVYYLWCMLKDLVNMIINNRKRTETLMENDEYFCDRMSDISDWTINLSKTQARNHQKITKFIDDMAALGSNTKENGFLSEVAPQSLVFSGEPDALVSIKGRDITEKWGTLEKEPNVGWANPSSIDYQATPIVTTQAINSSRFAIMKIGDVVEATYTNLKNSRLGDKKINSIKYFVKLVELTGPSNQIALEFFADPTTSFYSHSWNGNGQKSKYKYQVDVTFFDENGNAINPSLDNPAMLSFASLNSKEGQGEYASDFSGKFIPITGSTISIINDKAMNYSNQEQDDKALENGSPNGSWDEAGNPYEYIGAVAGLATDPIRFSFGNTSGLAQLFVFNTNVKAPTVNKPILEELPALEHECNIKEFDC